MRILVVIPARGGSKGILLKNIYPIKGKPMLSYAINSMIASKVSCTIAVSTDSDKIAEAARRYEEVIVIKRPDDISTDTASTESALLHALQYMKEQYDKSYDYIMTLPVTSPLRKPSTIKEFVDSFDRKKDIYDAQLTLHASYSDYWIKDKKGEFSRLYKNAPRRRQERDPIYIENSAIYITSVKSLIKTGIILGSNPTGFIIDEIEGLDINELNDVKIVESYIK